MPSGRKSRDSIWGYFWDVREIQDGSSNWCCQLNSPPAHTQRVLSTPRTVIPEMEMYQQRLQWCHIQWDRRPLSPTPSLLPAEVSWPDLFQLLLRLNSLLLEFSPEFQTAVSSFSSVLWVRNLGRDQLGGSFAPCGIAGGQVPTLKWTLDGYRGSKPASRIFDTWRLSWQEGGATDQSVYTGPFSRVVSGQSDHWHSSSWLPEGKFCRTREAACLLGSNLSPQIVHYRVGKTDQDKKKVHRVFSDINQ